MASVNKVILVGHLGQDPSISNLPNTGAVVAEFSLATSESWKDKNSGEYKSNTEWHKVKIFNERIANFCKEYLHKGMRVYVEGRLQTSTWNDKNGIEKKKTEIVLTAYKGEVVILENKKDSEVAKTHGEQSQYRHTDPQTGGGQTATYDGLDDEVPF